MVNNSAVDRRLLDTLINFPAGNWEYLSKISLAKFSVYRAKIQNRGAFLKIQFLFWSI